MTPIKWLGWKNPFATYLGCALAQRRRWVSIFWCRMVTFRVTRFGEISPLWQNFESLWQLFDKLFSILPNFETMLVIGKILYVKNGQVLKKYYTHLVTLLNYTKSWKWAKLGLNIRSGFFFGGGGRGSVSQVVPVPDILQYRRDWSSFKRLIELLSKLV